MNKIYNKKGNTTYKEKKMVKDIQNAIAKRQFDNPNFSYQPAENYEDLEKMHKYYTSTEVEYEDVKAPETENKEEQHKEFVEGMKDSMESKSDINDSNFIDPFNDAEPIVRDYVMDGGLDKEKSESSGSSNFDEPVNLLK